ncbi:MAG: Na+/H+ antiporter subunit D [Yaniella sp.]|uniref:Na+/H+ antiporter subunit D n=1 Tax=Yaniella sp. TaxID=2773929 RepID=UPI0026492936|nr:Na+/H+ antiporter subunit D [Yaniella sp.]MDN5705127.1 Na+/H+ antiporter subunit D [Yaniella sp.]MDN5731327.1 Na+/H+ antiporter subunit D [Yaniella sp.]MDN5743427.1 Na+/H+ antiporter subunit D [Yaniella sp.]MDN5815003.1 Na+/H+ antiporter subunit D [Yaniella sp.]MDN5817837.1 Na+/H+ antiporter subunit D [Yaniella sp.]
MNDFSVVSLAPLSVLLPILGAAIAFTLVRRPMSQIVVTLATMVITMSLEIWLLVDVWMNGGAEAVLLGGWEAPIAISLVVDRFSAIMLVVSSVVVLSVLLFASAQGLGDDEAPQQPVSIFHPTFLILTAGVSNAFLAGDLFNLYVGFEILLTASYVLLTIGGTGPRVRAGVTYVVVSVVSSVIFLVAIAMIYGATGTVNMADLAMKLGDLDPDLQQLLHLMLLVGFGIKAAVFPLSFWLPDSYPTAPAPVTAVFAGLLTKVGVYAIVRTETLLFPGDRVNTLLLVISGLTMIVGILGALVQFDIKRVLSFTLVSHIGYMIFGVSVANQVGLTATVFYVVHHITIQTALFLVTGLIEYRTGTANVDRLGSMAKISPLVAILFLVPALNLGGIPPFSGFLGKVGLIEGGVVNGSPLAWVMVAASVVTSLLTLMVMMRIWTRVFWRPIEDSEDPAMRGMEEAKRAEAKATPLRTDSRGLVVPTVGLVTVGVALTFVAGPLFDFADKAANDMIHRTPYIEAVLGEEAAQEAQLEADVLEDWGISGSDGAGTQQGSEGGSGD